MPNLFEVIEQLRKRQAPQPEQESFALKPFNLSQIPTEQPNISVQDLLARANPEDETRPKLTLPTKQDVDPVGNQPILSPRPESPDWKNILPSHWNNEISREEAEAAYKGQGTAMPRIDTSPHRLSPAALAAFNKGPEAWAEWNRRQQLLPLGIDLFARANPPEDNTRPALQPIPQPDVQPSSDITLRPMLPAPAPVTEAPRLSLDPSSMVTAPPTDVTGPSVAAPYAAHPLDNQNQRAAVLARGGNANTAIAARDPLEAEQSKFNWLSDPANKVVNKPDEGKDHAGWKGRLKDALLASLYAAGEQVKANGGHANGGTLGAALAGGVGGALRPQWNEELTRQRDIQQSGQRVGMMQEQRAGQLATLKSQADLQGKTIANQAALTDLQHAMLTKDPLWEVVTHTKQITPEQAKYFNAKLGINLSPASWQDYIEKVDPATGKSLIRPTTDPRYVTNPTISPDMTVPPVSVKVGDIPLTLKPPAVANMIVSENQANATRTQQTNIHNASQKLEAAKAFASATAKYNSDLMHAQTGMITELGKTLSNYGEVQGAQAKAESIHKHFQEVAAQLEQLDPAEKAYAAVEKQFTDLQKQFGAAQQEVYKAAGKTTAGAAVVEQLKALKDQIKKPDAVNASPVTPVQTQTITPNKTLSKAAVQQAAKEHKVSYQEAERQAKAQGYVIQ